METKILSHKDLIVWQKSITLSLLVYKSTQSFPREEIYGLTSQIRRATISIPSNIAEGRMRGTRKDFVNFLRIAMGSCAELRTQLLIAKELLFLKREEYDTIEVVAEEVSKMLSGMISKLNKAES